MEWATDRHLGATSAVMCEMYDCCGEEGADTEDKTLNLPFNLDLNPHLLSEALCIN